MSFENYCGPNSVFWDTEKTWLVDNPDLSHCFQRTVLVWLPCLLLAVLAPYELIALHRSAQNGAIPYTLLNISKFVFSGALLLVQLTSLVYEVVTEGGESPLLPPEAYTTPVLLIIALSVALVLSVLGRLKGRRSSGVLWTFWLIHCICATVEFRTRILFTMSNLPEINTNFKQDVTEFVLYSLYFSLLVGQWLLHCWSDAALQNDTTGEDQGLSPELGASFLGQLTFAWFDPMAWLGWRHGVTRPDLYDLNPADRCDHVVPAFLQHWDRTLARARTSRNARAKAPAASAAPSNHTVASFAQSGEDVKFSGLPSTPTTATAGDSDSERASILPSLFSAFGGWFLFGSMLKLLYDVLQFVNPQILSLIVVFVSTGNEPTWHGIVYVVLMVTVSILMSFLLNRYFVIVMTVGMRMRTALIAAVYRKALTISNTARRDTTVGEIVNLMSVDAQRFMDLTSYISLLWSAPLQIALAIFFLYRELGPSVFAGLAVMIILMPLNGVIANITKKLQLRQMKHKDHRVKIMNEILNGIKVLKLYAWEPSFEKRVLSIRDQELKVLRHTAYLNAGTSFIWTSAPFIVCLASFATFVLSDPENNILDSKRAFVSLALFNALRFPLSMLPMIMITCVQANVSLKRMNKFLNNDDLDSSAVTTDSNESDPVVVKQATFSWDRHVGGSHQQHDHEPLSQHDALSTREQPPAATLTDINLRVRPGSLVAIVGTVGSGKSSLLSALLGEMEKYRGSVHLQGSVAYVAQEAWIQNATLRDNVLFGCQFECERYCQCVQSCALAADFEMLPAGDATEIGEKGINLSGGQKQRVALARAVYSDNDIYLLDDPLSAVDAHVGKHLFERVIGPEGMLKNKTRLLVTHSVTYLAQADQVVVMRDGRISEAGTYQELVTAGGEFANFLLQYLNTASENDEDGDELDELKHQLEEQLGRDQLEFQLSLCKQQCEETEQQTDRSRSSSQMAVNGGGTLMRSRSSCSKVSNGKSPATTAAAVNSPAASAAAGKTPTAVNGKLVDAEKSETGKVQLKVYVYYMKAVGVFLAILTFALYISAQAFSVGSNIWLARWTDDVSAFNDTSKRDLYLGVYGALGLGQAVFSLFAGLFLSVVTLAAAGTIHSNALSCVLRFPLSFFDVTPSGRTVNRFSKDVDALDNTLPQNLRSWMYCFQTVLGTFFAISYATPMFILVILPVLGFYYFMQLVYVATSRQLKRFESVSRSPIYSHFSETITGASTIRAFDKSADFILQSEEKLNENQICYYPSMIANRWLAFRLDMVGTVITCAASLLAVLARDNIDEGLVGMSVSYAMQVTQTLNWLVRMSSDVETNIVAVERIREYSELEQEADWYLPDHGAEASDPDLEQASGADLVRRRGPPADWPHEGRVEFADYQTRYRPGLDLVLRGITTVVSGGEKVGIVGRTGAGKSSLTMALFRILEAASGSITVDGIRLSEIGLHDVRGRFTIIPQDPVLFSGSLRHNLDPFSRHSDEQLWRSLQLSHLHHFVSQLPAGLQHEVNEGGSNLSVGQRQLVCLARALLRKSRLLVLDEATAALDLETDNLIQSTIRSEFADCTVLTIAHRLNTIMDNDRVMVLSAGRIVEYAPPAQLLADTSSVFYGMAKSAGVI